MLSVRKETMGRVCASTSGLGRHDPSMLVNNGYVRPSLRTRVVPKAVSGIITARFDAQSSRSRFIKVPGDNRWVWLFHDLSPDPVNFNTLLKEGQTISVILLEGLTGGFKETVLCCQAEFIPVADAILDAILKNREFEIGRKDKGEVHPNNVKELFGECGVALRRRNSGNTFDIRLKIPCDKAPKCFIKATLVASGNDSLRTTRVRLSLLPGVHPTVINVIRTIAVGQLIAFPVDC
jgi:hypothetical protein